jgi:hypothetical protein
MAEFSMNHHDKPSSITTLNDSMNAPDQAAHSDTIFTTGKPSSDLEDSLLPNSNANANHAVNHATRPIARTTHATRPIAPTTMETAATATDTATETDIDTSSATATRTIQRGHTSTTAGLVPNTSLSTTTVPNTTVPNTKASTRTRSTDNSATAGTIHRARSTAMAAKAPTRSATNNPTNKLYSGPKDSNTMTVFTASNNTETF